MPNKLVHIIIVEDDKDQREELVSGLSHDKNFRVVGVTDSNELYRLLLSTVIDIIVLDLGLPGEDGFEIARQLRSIPQTSWIGVIMLTGYSNEKSRVQGLQCGADVYLVKPVNMAELSAQIKSLARRMRLPQMHRASNTWKYRSATRTLVCPSGRTIELTHKEASLIDLLIRNAGHPVSRRDIIRKAFGEDPLHYDERRLEAIVSRLRKKIRGQSPLQQPITVAHAFGYIFSDPVEYL